MASLLLLVDFASRSSRSSNCTASNIFLVKDVKFSFFMSKNFLPRYDKNVNKSKNEFGFKTDILSKEQILQTE